MVKLKPLSICLDSCDFVYEVVNGKQDYKTYIKYVGDDDFGVVTNADIDYCRVWYEGNYIFLDYKNGRNGIPIMDINKEQIDNLLFRFGGNIKEMLEYILDRVFIKMKK